MIRSLLRWTIVLVACTAAGCGSGHGLETGIPKNPEVPFNPTPDMGPNPGAEPKK